MEEQESKSALPESLKAEGNTLIASNGSQYSLTKKRTGAVDDTEDDEVVKLVAELAERYGRNELDFGDPNPLQPVPMPGASPTFGQQLMGVDFNPSGLEFVQRVKQQFAEMVDELAERESKGPVSPAADVKYRSAYQQLQLAKMAVIDAFFA